MEHTIYGVRMALSTTLNFKADSCCYRSAIAQYFSNWQTALYAQQSQPAIKNIASILSKLTDPRLTVSSLLSAVIDNYSVNNEIDQWLIAMLPSGKAATSLDMSQIYMATQLGDLLTKLLMDMNTDFQGGGFSLFAQHGQMMNMTTNWVNTLEDSLAGMNVSGYAGM